MNGRAEQPASPTTRAALVTGSSRGVGAETARQLALRGYGVVVNYRDKAKRAECVVDEIRASGGQAIAIRADLTDVTAVDAMIHQVGDTFGGLDLLVLNASGGMERGADPGYALRLNCDAQLGLVERASPLLRVGSRVVFVTSHQAHFHQQHPVPPAYEPVARSKRAGEDALRARAPELASRGVGLVVVSGDMIEGTITVTLLERAQPGTLAARLAQVSEIPTIQQFAAEIVDAATAMKPPRDTVYVGGADYLSEPH